MFTYINAMPAASRFEQVFIHPTNRAAHQRHRVVGGENRHLARCGTQQKVLVPQLYVKLQLGDLDGSGALLAGKDVNIHLSGDLTNSGTIAGRNVVNLTA